MRKIVFTTLLITLLVLTLVLFTLYYVLDSIESEKKLGGFKEITGTSLVFDIPHAQNYPPFRNFKTTEKYDDKFFAYLESMQDARDKTFMRGKVFLEEK